MCFSCLDLLILVSAVKLHQRNHCKYNCSCYSATWINQGDLILPFITLECVSKYSHKSSKSNPIILSLVATLEKKEIKIVKRCTCHQKNHCFLRSQYSVCQPRLLGSIRFFFFLPGHLLHLHSLLNPIRALCSAFYKREYSTSACTVR